MRTSLNEIKRTESHLAGDLEPEERLLFEAEMLVNADLRMKVKWQIKAVQIIHLYGREKLKEDLENVHQKLFTEHRHHGFARRIQQIFTGK